MVFVDTSAWYASFVPDDTNHQSATQWLQQNQQPLLTTDYIIDETLTLLRVRGYGQLALDAGEQLLGGLLADLLFVTDADVMQAWEVFRTFRDKGWSFTDCTSKIIIERLPLAEAFAFDQHYRQFGTVRVVP